MVTKPFWDESYKRPGRLDTFGGGKPSREVVQIADKLPPGSQVLDLGCGEGRQALYLAKMGFGVSAVDISTAGIDKIHDVAATENIKIDAVVCDMRQYGFPRQFDLIVCHGCLHLISREDWRGVVLRMKEATVPGGYNLVGVFTNTVPEPEDQRGLMIGLSDEGELMGRYSDWQVLDSTSYRFEHEHPDGPRHEHSGNSVVARKPL